MPVQERRHFLGCPPTLERLQPTQYSKVDTTVRCASEARSDRRNNCGQSARQPGPRAGSNCIGFPPFFHQANRDYATERRR
jgi:hypothetical protein